MVTGLNRLYVLNMHLAGKFRKWDFKWGSRTGPKEAEGRWLPVWTTRPCTHFFLGQIFCKSLKRSLGGTCTNLGPPNNCGIYGRIEIQVITFFGQLTFELIFFWVRYSVNPSNAALEAHVRIQDLQIIVECAGGSKWRWLPVLDN